MAIVRNWKRPFAHSSACRDKIMTKMLDDGDVGGRVQAAMARVFGGHAADEGLPLLT